MVVGGEQGGWSQGSVGRVKGGPACLGRHWGLPPCGLLGIAFEEDATSGPVQRHWLSALPIPGVREGQNHCLIFQVGRELERRGAEGKDSAGWQPRLQLDKLT